MKCAIFAGLLLISFAAVVLSDSGAYYAPEYTEYQTPETTGVRTKRYVDPASLAFLVGVGAGGIFGPILYNRLYGRRGASNGWYEPEPQGWEPSKGGY